MLCPWIWLFLFSWNLLKPCLGTRWRMSFFFFSLFFWSFFYSPYITRSYFAKCMMKILIIIIFFRGIFLYISFLKLVQCNSLSNQGVASWVLNSKILLYNLNIQQNCIFFRFVSSYYQFLPNPQPTVWKIPGPNHTLHHLEHQPP